MERKQTNRTYDRIAGRYARRDVYPMTRELKAFLAHIPEGSTVVDIGCGTGEYARKITTEGYRVIALDLSAGMLRQARACGTSRILQADMRHLPLTNRTADGCFLSASLLHVPRAEVSQVLDEVRRVLQNTGVAFLSVKAGEGSAWVTEPEGGARFFVYYRPDALDQQIISTGFEIVEGWLDSPGPGQSHCWIDRVIRKVSQ